MDGHRNPFAKLNRDLAFIMAGIVGLGALIGVPIGIAFDVLWHRHRRA